MTKSALSLWDPTAANNTDIGGIATGEGAMLVSAVNNAMREMMAQIASEAAGRLIRNALANGSDDATAIQAAVTAGAGGTVTFAKGKSYGIATNITVPANTIVDLNGSTITLLSGADRAFLVQGDGATIRNGTLVCGLLGAGVTALDFDDVTLENVTITNPLSVGFRVYRGHRPTANGVRVTWGATHPANAVFGIDYAGSTGGVGMGAMDRPKVIDCEVDMSLFAAAEMYATDSCVLIRGDEQDNVQALFPVVRNLVCRQPVGTKALYVDDSKRPTGLEVRMAADVNVENVTSIGGDLTMSFGNVSRAIIDRFVSRSQTTYGIEVAQDCRDFDIFGMDVRSLLSIHTIAVTNRDDVRFFGGKVIGGVDTNADGTADTGSRVVAIEESGDANAGRTKFVGVFFQAQYSTMDIIRNAGPCELLELVDCTFRASSSAINCVHNASGTVDNLIIRNATVSGGAMRLVQNAGIISHLGVTDARGTAGTANNLVNSGTITASAFANNSGIGTGYS